MSWTILLKGASTSGESSGGIESISVSAPITKSGSDLNPTIGFDAAESFGIVGLDVPAFDAGIQESSMIGNHFVSFTVVGASAVKSAILEINGVVLAGWNFSSVQPTETFSDYVDISTAEMAQILAASSLPQFAGFKYRIIITKTDDSTAFSEYHKVYVIGEDVGFGSLSIPAGATPDLSLYGVGFSDANNDIYLTAGDRSIDLSNGSGAIYSFEIPFVDTGNGREVTISGFSLFGGGVIQFYHNGSSVGNIGAVPQGNFRFTVDSPNVSYGGIMITLPDGGSFRVVGFKIQQRQKRGGV